MTRRVSDQMFTYEQEMAIVEVVERYRFHVWRWRLLSMVMVLGSIIVIVAFHDDRNTAARATGLERANCILKKFLVNASNTRAITANDVGLPLGLRFTNHQAAMNYRDMANTIFATGDHCEVRSYVPLNKIRSY